MKITAGSRSLLGHCTGAAIIVVAALWSTSAGAQNLVQNGGFEEGVVPPWAVYFATGAQFKATSSLEGVPPSTGSYLGGISVQSGQDATVSIEQTIASTAAGSYTLCARIFAHNHSSGTYALGQAPSQTGPFPEASSVSIQIYSHPGEVDEKQEAQFNFAASSANWVPLQLKFPHPGGGLQVFAVHRVAVNSGRGWAASDGYLLVSNQTDTDGNGLVDDCEDKDFDDIAKVEDNCPSLANTAQADANGDGVGDACSPCGDGDADSGEQCDDQNFVSLDGCDVNCKLEPGWSCTSTLPTSCTAICADGIVVSSEGCDDKNAIGGDGCKADCSAIEGGWTCPTDGQPCIQDPNVGPTVVVPVEFGIEFTIDEDTSLPIEGVTVSDPDTHFSTGELKMTLTCSKCGLSLSPLDGLDFKTGDGTKDPKAVFTGTVDAINAALAGLVYHPNQDAEGLDVVSVKANDLAATGTGGAKSDTNSFEVFLTAYNDGPTITGVFSAQTDEDITLPLPLVVLDPDSNDTDVSVEVSVDVGTLTLASPGALDFSEGGSGESSMVFVGKIADITTAFAGLTYVPLPGYGGDDIFEMTISDGGASGLGGTLTQSHLIDIEVTPVADTPGIEAGDAQGDEDTAIPLGITADLSDTDGSEAVEVTISGVPDGGSLSAGTPLESGLWSVAPSQLEGLTLTPPENSDVDASLVLTASATEALNGDLAVKVVNIEVTVVAVADTPTLVLPGGGGDEDNVLPAVITSFLQDSDGSESLLVVITDVLPTSVFSAGVEGPVGTWTLQPDDLPGLTYIPPEHKNGDLVMTVTSTATEAANSDAAVASGQMTISVNAINDVPVANDDDRTTPEDVTLVLPVQNLLANDTDADSSDVIPEVLIVTDIAEVTNGTLVYDGSAPIEFTPSENFHGTASFLYTITDSHGANDTATVTITVENVNDDPVAEDDTAATWGEEPVVITPLANDSDVDTPVDGDVLTIATAGPAPGGVITIAPDKLSLTYTRKPGYFGIDTFPYTVSDGRDGTATANIAVTVTACGDGVVRADKGEHCDDGDVTSGDGCDSVCDLEEAWTCIGLAPTECTRTCASVFELDANDGDWLVSGSSVGFQHGASAAFGGAGFETALNADLAEVAVDSTLKRPVRVPLANITSEPRLLVHYQVLGNGVQDCLHVYVDDTAVIDTEPRATVCKSTTEPTRLAVDLSDVAGQTVFVSIRAVAPGSLVARPGLFIDRIVIGSDIDNDQAYEYNAWWPQVEACDPCIDEDGDGYGDPDSAALGECKAGDHFDCNDEPASGGAVINADAIELCSGGIDENCNADLDQADLQCQEDCANGKDDHGNGIIDCDELFCADDPYCSPCNIDYNFTTGGGHWTPDGELWEYVGPADGAGDGFWATAGLEDVPPGHQLGHLNLEVAVPPLTEMPQPTLLVDYRLQGEPNPAFDKLAICIDDPDCGANTPTNVFSSGVNTAGQQTATVDLTDHAGTTIVVSITYDTISGVNNDFDGARITRVAIESDVDADAGVDGADPSCDRCWDADQDGYVRPDSPGLAESGVCVNETMPDCDDTTAISSPGAGELCGEPADEDCDGLVNGFDPDCGSEDCANGHDDNGDDAADCDDFFCADDPFCQPCGRHFTFDTGDGGWLQSDNDPDGQPGTLVFQYGVSSQQQATGWATVLNGEVKSAGSGAVRATITRTVAVPGAWTAPAVELRYSLQGDTAINKDALLVCFDADPVDCVHGGPDVAFTTTTNTVGDGLDVAIVPIPLDLSGESVTVVVAYDTVDGSNNANPGLFIGDIVVRSDIDLDGVYESTLEGCDHCVDADKDGFGSPNVPPKMVSACLEETLDCNDDDKATQPGLPEDCVTPGDQNCNGLADLEEVICAACGDGLVTPGEECDDGVEAASGKPVSGDGCSSSCLVEEGWVYVTELHVAQTLGLPGEQWFELFNATAAPIDVSLMEMTFANGFGQVQSLVDGCTIVNPILAPKGFYVVALGDSASADGLAADAYCDGAVPLAAVGDVLTVGRALAPLDTVDFGGAGFGCALAGDTTAGKRRSLELIGAGKGGTAAGDNDSAATWCVSATTIATGYSTSGTHFGSPGGAGTCAEAACDGLDDDCDGLVDEGTPDADQDGLCDALDCDPSLPSCTTDCETDLDDDLIADCKDGCLDQDGDGYGSPAGLPVSTCAKLLGESVADCDDTSSTVSPGATENFLTGDSCTNGVDDNCDGLPDCADTNCDGKPQCAGESCAGAVPIHCGEVLGLDPQTAAFPCGPGKDAAVRFMALATETVTLRVTSGVEQQYGAWVFADGCTNNACNGAAQTVIASCTKAETVSVDVVEGTAYHVVLDQVSGCAGEGSSAATVQITCAEACAGGIDDDADGAVDCDDTDCAAVAACAGADADGDGVANGHELICDTSPVDPVDTPSAEDVADVDNDGAINCADEDDDGDGFDDVVELEDCALDAEAKNEATINPDAQKQCGQGGAVDADCNGAPDVTEDACGAKETQCADNQDNDADGKVDCLDSNCAAASDCAKEDFDADGVDNGVELQCGTSPLDGNLTPGPLQANDTDGDGAPNCADPDDDGDDFTDLKEVLCGSDPLDDQDVPLNADGDLQCDAVDPDDDNDSFVDALEIVCGSDPLSGVSTPADAAHDLDQDGICDANDTDADGDLWSNGVEQACGTEPLDAASNPTDEGLDGDSDKLCDALDPDDDNDDWSDEEEGLCGSDPNDPASVPDDEDGDGECDLFDADTDGDNWSDVLEDQCGTDPLDPTDNPSALGQDQDDDLLCDLIDSDDDGDNWKDLLEVQCQHDPADPADVPVDTDSDGLCNTLDDDDDNDQWKDTTEGLCSTDPLDAESLPTDADGDGLCDTVDSDADPDGDNWPTFQEAACGTDPKDPASTPKDTDGDSLCDALDDDVDGDGWEDTVEVECGSDPTDASLHPVDADNDSVCNAIDTDDDGDAWPDDLELLCGSDPLDATSQLLEIDLQDLDGDEVPNCIDDDIDGDGLSNLKEGLLGSDPWKVDTDGDGLDDGVEDANQDAVIEPPETWPTKPDTDFDGLSDGVEAGGCYLPVPEDPEACWTTDGTKFDTDADGLSDGQEDADGDGATGLAETNPLVFDTDDDGASDGEEVMCATDPLDASSWPTDHDDSGICDGAEVDTDGDGVSDGVELFCDTDPFSNTSTPSLGDLLDQDTDNQISCVDIDDDNDTFIDVHEEACNTDPRNAESVPTGVDVLDTDQDGLINCADDDDDGDGLTDDEEATYGTDPLDSDSDDDGLSDGKEIEVEGTDPLDADTDDDGLQDGTELGVVKGTPGTDTSVFIPDEDPSTVTQPKNPDTDDDQVLDGEEDANHNGRKDPGEGDPLSQADGLFDGDDDGLTDRDELLVYGTNPAEPDSDFDGVDDKLEIEVYGSDPQNPDSDQGGLPDGVEVQTGTDPTDPTDDYTASRVSGDTMFTCGTAPGPRGDTTSGAALLLTLLLGLALLRRRRVAPAALGVVAVCALIGGAPEAAAQQPRSVDVNIETFSPVGGRYRVWATEESLVGQKWQPYASILFHGEHEPLRVTTGLHEETVVEQHYYADINVGIGLFGFMQFDVSLPVALELVSGENGAVGSLSGGGLGDLLVRLRGTLLDNRLGGAGIGLTLGVTAPTGDGDKFRGDPGAGVLANLIFDWRWTYAALAFNAGVRVRTEEAQFLTASFGHELTWSVGLEVFAVRETLTIGLDVYGRTPLLEPFQEQDRTPIELLVGPKYWFYPGASLQAAFGAGILRGYGAPDFRFLIGVGWAPGHEDSDNDGLDDTVDQCPLEPEDLDGFEDANGCPEWDNDRDGIVDGDDQCPNEREDHNGIADLDGCPDGDADGDGIVDIVDKCPNDPEDHDGYQDGDGCEEPDNDADGIVDTRDTCPNSAETYNDFQDLDGCPDARPPVQDRSCEFTLPRIHFRKGSSGLLPEEQERLLKIVELVRARQQSGLPPVVKLEVAGHASEEGAEAANLALSRSRAERVHEFLARHGLPAALLSMRAYGEVMPVVDAQTEVAFERNRRVDFRITLGGKCSEAR